MPIHIKPINTFDSSTLDSLFKMIFHFYEEYDPTHILSKESINDTIIHLTHHPENGSIQAIYNEEDILVGYTILIKYWSNEYQGFLLFIDELYIIPAKRSLGYGRATIAAVEASSHGIKALVLEVSPKNIRAQSLYQTLGFEANKNNTLVKVINP